MMASMSRFDVFLCHNSADKPAVKAIAEGLKDAGLAPWLDEWELPPGQPWQDQLEARIGDIAAAAVFVGQDGEGPWQKLEIQAFLQRFVARKCPVIPVILPDYPKDEKPKLPSFLTLFTWVDFRRSDPDPLYQLVWGVTGQKPAAGQVPPAAAPIPRRPASPPASPRRWSWRQRISASLAVGLAGILVTLAVWWPRPAEEPSPPPVSPPAAVALYAVRVVVLGPDGRPVEGSTIHASVGNEPQRVAGGWEVEIPAAKLPASRRVEIRAGDPASSGSGEAEIVLGDDPTPSVEVQLAVVEARIRGLVLGADGRGLAGVRVSAVGYEGVVTGADGRFELAAHAPRGERVRLHAEGERVKDQYCFAGSDDCVIRLLPGDAR